jgi:hypothetical protein
MQPPQVGYDFDFNSIVAYLGFAVQYSSLIPDLLLFAKKLYGPRAREKKTLCAMQFGNRTFVL